MPADSQAQPSGGIREVRLHATIPIEGLIVYQSFASLTLTCSKEKHLFCLQNDLILFNFGIIHCYACSFIHQIFADINARRLPIR